MTQTNSIMECTYKIAMYSENRNTNKKYVDKVLNVTIEQVKYSRTNAVSKIHDFLTKKYDTKSRRYIGFDWIVSTYELKQ